MPNMKPKKPKRTQQQLAKLLGVSRQVIGHHVKSGKAPALEDIAAWESHLAVNGRAGSLAPESRDEIAVERRRILKATANRLEDEEAMRRGKFIDYDDVKQFHVRLIGQLFSDLDRVFANELPPALKGLDETAVRTRVLAEIEAIKERLRQFLTAWENERHTA